MYTQTLRFLLTHEKDSNNEDNVEKFSSVFGSNGILWFSFGK